MTHPLLRNECGKQAKNLMTKERCRLNCALPRINITGDDNNIEKRNHTMAPTSAVAAMAAAAATMAAATVTAAKPESVPAKAIVFAIGTAIVVASAATTKATSK